MDPGQAENVAATPKWREETSLELPGDVPSATPRRAVFLWLAALLMMAIATIAVFAWIRPTPKPFLATIGARDYPSPLLPPAFVVQDRKALSEGGFFSKPRAAIAQLASGDTLIVNVSGLASCDEKGRVRVLAADAGPTLTQGRLLEDILKALAGSPAQKKLLVLNIAWPMRDSYVGGLDDVASRIPEELAAVPDAKRLVLVACAPGQSALASPELGRSVFGYFLESGLRGWADYDASNPERQGLVTARKLAAYVQSRVSEWARQHGAAQTPTLHGDAPDFPLVAIERSQPRTDPERPGAPPYPDWLRAAWQARERWWAEARHRPAPWLFRKLENAIAETDERWRDGGDAEPLKRRIAETLEQLDKQYARLVAEERPAPLSLVQERALGKRGDDKLRESVKNLFKLMAAARLAAPKADEGEKAAAKLVEDFLDKHRDVPEFDWVAGIFGSLAQDPFPRRETLLVTARLLTARPGETRYAEADAVMRLARLAERFDDATWPAHLARKALLLTERGEESRSRWRSIAWLSDHFDLAARKRLDADLALHARGYVSLQLAETLNADALNAIDAVLAQQETLDGAERLVHDALVLLPGYVAYLEHRPALHPAWREAAQATGELHTLLSAPGELSIAQRNAKIGDLRGKSTTLRDALARLAQSHDAATVEDVLARAGRPDADAKTLHALEAQLTLPFHSAENRARLWQARGTLAKKLADKFFEDIGDLLGPVTRSDSDEQHDRAAAQRRILARAERSLALLRLTTPPSEELAAIETLINGTLKKEDTWLLATRLRRAWSEPLPKRIADAEPVSREWLSRTSPLWLRLGTAESELSKAAWLSQQERERRLWGLLAGQYRDESAEPMASPFALRAAFALRDYAPAEPELTLPASVTQAAVTPAKPNVTINIPLRWTRLPKTNPPLRVTVLTADDDWLQIAPRQESLEALTRISRDTPGQMELPIGVTLKPQAELSASPRPLGFLVRVEMNGRAYHHAVSLPLLPAAERLEILVSADPKSPSVTLGDLRLRPSKDRQAFHVYVANRGKLPRNLTVELRAGDRVVAGGTVSVAMAADQVTRVVFGAKLPAPSDGQPGKKGSPLQGPVLLPELTGPLTIRLLDKDRKDEVVAVREVRVDLADPREYVRVPSIRFEPPSKENQGKNRLDVTVQAVRKLAGPPCVVELVVPKDRIAGLAAVRAGIFRGELPEDGSPLKLFAGDLQFDAFADDAGPVYLTVDGIERAFIFRTTFVPVGEATIPREELRPALRVRTGAFYKTNTKFEVVAEVDHAPADAKLLVSLGQMRGDVFEAEIKATPRRPREKRVGVGISAEGGLEFDTVLRDWVVPFDAVPVRGERVVEARLVDANGVDLVPPARARVLFDDRLPERVTFVELPKQVKRDVPILLKASAIDRATGIKEAYFFLGKPTEDGKLPQGAVKLDAAPSKTEAGVWQAIVNWPTDKRGPIHVSVAFTNRLDLTAFVTEVVELVDFDPVKAAPGTIEGTVVEGTRTQEDVVVALLDAKGNKLLEQKTQKGGTFAFPNLLPGIYTVRATKPTAGTPLVGTVRVELAPGQSKRITVSLFLQ